MFEGLLAAIALFFSGAPAVAPEPAPIVAFDTGPGEPDFRCKSPPMLFVHVTETNGLKIIFSSPHEGISEEIAPGDLKAALARRTALGSVERVYVGASNDTPYGYVTGQIAWLQSQGVRKIALVEDFNGFRSEE